MGLANLVPGISGGTMLLAAGVYPLFIQGVADLTTLRLRSPNLVGLGAIVVSAALAILLLAGTVKGLVVDHRWAMYSLFIGLTLGGVPVIWRLLRPMTASAALSCAVGIAVMAVMAFVQPGAAPGETPSAAALLFGGLAGASAMILPGVSGGYLLLVMGLYLPILGAIDAAKQGLTAYGGPDWGAIFDAFHVFVPVGIGVVAGVVGVSNLLRYFLNHFQKATLGLLLGLLLGAVLGLWPFQRGVAPVAGEVVKGQMLTEATAAEVHPDDYPVEIFTPTALEVVASLALIGVGFVATQGVARLGRSEAPPGGARRTPR